MTPVVLESPFQVRTLNVRGGQVHLTTEDNVAYAQACVRDCLRREEAPLVPDFVFTQTLDLTDPHQKWDRGQAALPAKRVVYVDRGIDDAMAGGILEARELGQEVEYRQLEGEWAILEIASQSVEELLDELGNERG